MTEEEARQWVGARFDTTTVQRLEKYADLVEDENQRQNLISPATVAMMWSRHIVDSLQLLTLANPRAGWLDIGSGGGFPGLPLAIGGVESILLVEPRKRRAEFLTACIARLGLTNATVNPAKVEQVGIKAEVITARAVASVEKLLHAAAHCGTPTTRWLLPRGSADLSSVLAELAAKSLVFHVEQSVTEAASSILVIDGMPS